MSGKKQFFTAQNVAIFGVLMALAIVMQVFGGSFTIGTISLNFSLIPIVLAALVVGELGGALVGLGCGIVILIQVIIAPSGFYYIIWSYSPVVTILICLLKTTVAGYVSGVVFKALQKKNSVVAVFVSSGLVPFINTALFVLGCLCMSDTIGVFQQSMPAEYTGMNVLVFVLVVLVTINFFVEFAVNLLVAPAIHTVYKVVAKNLSK